jgi:HAMP domain-containing protein
MDVKTLLFDTPWWLPTAVVAVGAVLFYTANKRQEGRLRTIGIGVALLGVVLAAVSYFVDTDLEKAVKRTKQLVSAFEKKEWETMRSLLHPKASLGILNFQATLYNDRDTIVAKAAEAHQKYNFKSVDVQSVEARQDQTLITVTLRLWSEQDVSMGRRIPSTWQFDWQESSDGWYLYDVRAVEIGRMQAQQMEPMFPKR